MTSHCRRDCHGRGDLKIQALGPLTTTKLTKLTDRIELTELTTLPLKVRAIFGITPALMVPPQHKTPDRASDLVLCSRIIVAVDRARKVLGSTH